MRLTVRSASVGLVRPYFSGEREADFAVHLFGITSGISAAAVLLALTAAALPNTVFLSLVAYAVGLVAMLVASAAYHLRGSSRRHDLLRRLDHAAIFVMIAGTYTPFIVSALTGAPALWLAGLMWVTALAGVVVKLRYRRRYEGASIAGYLVMGWAGILFMPSLLAALDPATLILLASGGALYTIGACLHRWRRLPFHDATWHSLVLAAAGLHYAAIMHSIVLPAMMP